MLYEFLLTSCNFFSKFTQIDWQFDLLNISNFILYSLIVPNLLIILLGSSLVGFLILTCIPSKSLELLRFVSFCYTIWLFVWSLILWLFFENDIGVFQFLVFFQGFPLFGIDGLSLISIILTTFIFVCVFPLIWSVNLQLKFLILLLALLEILLLIVFSILDLFLFYISFELILVPMVLIIFIWGSRTRKIKAGFYFFLYTLLGSLFMLLGLIILYSELGSTNILYLLHFLPSYEKQLVFWSLFFLSFAIKIPMFPFHIWLPEAHVEAPTIGSVLLAGLLLKLGGYGFLRILIPLFPEATIFFTPFILTLAIVGMFYASLTLFRQIDIKKIIAYSSIAHMNFAILGMFSNTLIGLQGSLFLLISHGFSSSALFILVGLLYERYHTRLLHYYGGLIQLMPLYTFFFFYFTIASFGFPGFSNFIGEILILLGLISQSFSLLMFAGLGWILSVVYSISLFNRLCFGELKFTYVFFNFYNDLTKREFFVLLFLGIFILFFGLFPNSILDLMSYTIMLLL
jgi:proton-translocating NADH-quinone oxidoreductase chain M